jgi:large subunit ribosomal protein L24
MPRVRVKKGDQVVVVSGKDKGKRGRVIRVSPAESKVLVEGVNMIKRHTRPIPQRNIKGGIVEREAPVHLSNVMVLDPETDRPSRVGVKVLDDGRRVRVSKRSGAILDK